MLDDVFVIYHYVSRADNSLAVPFSRIGGDGLVICVYWPSDAPDTGK